MSNMFVLHGSFGAPSENWFPWLASKWQAAGYGLGLTPAFPSPDGQTFDNWAAILDAYRSIGVLNADSIIVAHSSSCVFTVRYALDRGMRVRALATVAGFNNFQSGDEAFDAINGQLFLPEAELPKAQDISDVRLAYYSDNDPYLPRGLLDNFAQTVAADTTVIEGGGHLNTEAGYTEFQQLFEALEAAGAA